MFKMQSTFSVTLFSVIFLALQSTSITTGYNLAVVTWGNPSAELANLNTDGQDIIGIARLRNFLYVVCVMSDSIFVFRDFSPYERVNVIQVAALSGMGAGDMVADPDSGLLYIIDWRAADQGGTRVWSVNPILQTAEYLVNATGWTGTLYITVDRQILGVTGNGRLQLCSNQPPAVCTTVDLTDANITAPQHAVHTCDNTFYVSQGWTGGQPHRVKQLSSTGQMLYQYGDINPGNGTGQLNWPRHIALGPMGLVLVADFWNRRVVQLDANLSTATDLLSATNTPGFGWPQRLLAAKANDKLTCRDGKLKVYVAMVESAPLWG